MPHTREHIEVGGTSGDHRGKRIYGCQPEVQRGGIESLCGELKFHVAKCCKACQISNYRGKEKKGEDSVIRPEATGFTVTINHVGGPVQRKSQNLIAKYYVL